MQTPVQIVLHEFAHSPALEALIREKAGKLSGVFPRLSRCHIAVEQPHRHDSQGRLFNVRLTLHVPGNEIVVNRHLQEDAQVAVREAFEAARRELEEHAGKVRRDMKQRCARTAAGSGEPS
ncbi:MAG TPA: HPF/RaiA family ribosome-associated protein [Burkholderiales bacterium]|nr:HPF/RaiA family ribosome-associated protein [Burkholderiales bacterium]